MVKKYAGGKATTTRTRKEKKNWWPHLTSSSPEAKVENLGFAVKRYPLKIKYQHRTTYFLGIYKLYIKQLLTGKKRNNHVLIWTEDSKKLFILLFYSKVLNKNKILNHN